MEYVAFEKGALELVTKAFEDFRKRVTSCCGYGGESIQDEWIDNGQLAETLGISIRTLADCRARGKLGFTIVGRKIWYKISDVETLLENHKVKSLKEASLRKK